jgi:hypothetical protein
MTVGLPPSITATQELVVPKSMPTIFPMIYNYFLNNDNSLDGGGDRPS